MNFRETLARLQHNLNILQEREAKHGGQSPLALLNQIEDHRQAITLTEKAIAGDLPEADWREVLKPLNIDHTIIEGGFFQKILKALSLPSEQQRELRNRQIMLQRVHDFWIKGVLETSLHNEVLITLGMETKPEAVDYPWDMVIQRPGQPDRTLPPGTKMIDVFDESGGSLLILGEPGSGKTTMLLELCRQLVERTQADPPQLIPVIFNLSSWAQKQLPLEGWLVEELYGKYSIPRKLAHHWVNNDDLLLLLDGLDEVASIYRDACVEAINQFYQDQMPTLVVCSRTADYETLATQLRLQSAVLLQPLTLEQVGVYLSRQVPESSALKMIIQNDRKLQEFVSSPLALNILTLTFQEIPDKVPETDMPLDTYRERIFDAYIRRMFRHRRGDQRYYSPEYTLRCLSVLAQKMKQHDQTTFFIEQIQASWLSSRQQRWLYEISLRLIGGVAFFVIGALSVLLSLWLIDLIEPIDDIPSETPALVVGLMPALAFVLSSVFAIRYWILPLIILAIGGGLAVTGFYSPFVALIIGIIFGLPGAIAGLPIAQHGSITFSDTITWTWKKAYWGLLVGLAIGLMTWIFSPNDKLVNSLEIGLPIVLILMLILGLGRVEYIYTQTKLKTGFSQSSRNAFNIGGIAAIILVLISILIGFLSDFASGAAFGIFLGIIGFAAGLYSGGNACLQHGLLRFALALSNEIPWDSTRFLDHTVNHIFMRKIGQGYIFVHRWLLDHFAKLEATKISKQFNNRIGGN